MPQTHCLTLVVGYVQLIMNIPFTAVHFSTYEATKKFLAESEEDEGLLVQCVAGGLAGGLAAAVTNPLDVVKTRLQTDAVTAHKSGSIGPQTVVRHTGLTSSFVFNIK